jgi:uncharacterized protein YggE
LLGDESAGTDKQQIMMPLSAVRRSLSAPRYLIKAVEIRRRRIASGAKFASTCLLASWRDSRDESGLDSDVEIVHAIPSSQIFDPRLDHFHRERFMKIKLGALLGVLMAPLSGHAQDRQAPLEAVPQIAVTGRGEVKVSPDRATIQISVQTRAATAAAAAAENANKTQAVLAALRGLGLGNDQLSTINYNINPEQRYEPNREPVVIGYTVTNTILADVRRLNQVGPVIDAAVSRGANVITSLQFYASNTEAARRTAIAAAIEKARADAEAAAKAARGALGTLLEINIGAYSPPPPQPMMMAMKRMEAQADTPINPGQETLAVDVITRWRFIPGQ